MSIALGGASFGVPPVPAVDIVKHWPSDFGGNFQTMVNYCAGQNRELTIIVDADVVVPGGSWNFNPIGNTSVTFDCGSTQKPWVFEESGQVSVSGIACLKGFSYVRNPGSSCGFIVENPHRLIVDGNYEVTSLESDDSTGAPLFYNNTTAFELWLKNASVHAGNPSGPYCVDGAGQLAVFIDAGGVVYENSIATGSGNPIDLTILKSAYTYGIVSSLQPTGINFVSQMPDTQNVDADFEVWPCHKQLFVDSAGCHKIHFPRFPYDGEFVSFTDRQITTTFASDPVDLDSLSGSTTIQDPNSPTNFAPSVPLKDKGMSITYVYDMGADKWRIRSIYR